MPSRKLLLSGALALGALVAFALITGLSGGRKQNKGEAGAELQAASPPESLKSGLSGYADDAAPARLDELAPPVDPLWGDPGPRLQSQTEDDPHDDTPDYSLQGAVPDRRPTANAPDPAEVEREAARTSAIFFTGRERGASTKGLPPSSLHPARLEPPASRAILQAGTVIPAALRTAINSDAPGAVIAQTTQPVFDSLTGEHLLIPQGSRLIGRYRDDVVYGDRRLVIAWDRMILGDGWSISLTGFEAADAAGAAGISARTDNHLDRIAVASVLSGALSTAANAAQDDRDSPFARSVGDAAAQEAARVGGRIVDRELSVKPTLKAPAGAPIQVMVTKDLVLDAYPG